ncbi:2-acylglycerol O-acyltransferase 2-like protein [Leptotrombidium deliense]|uniref:2-acylglycerol O-acyltransferase 2-like protein n=1 Tax=Leptotrombidium deliense TaxID=299467 RepID=A0A443SA32_9ACAR|nr:2-acylglycerol O-acyltransferase 2-like protein [Leptotrombidium deliense]
MMCIKSEADYKDGTDLFAQTEHTDDSFVKRLQRKLTRIFRFAPPMFHGRGIFQYNIGYLPYRKPVNTIGKQ